mgnify:CR=1 FL=1
MCYSAVKLHVYANLMAISMENVQSVNDSALPHHALIIYLQQWFLKSIISHIQHPYHFPAEWTWPFAALVCVTLVFFTISMTSVM